MNTETLISHFVANLPDDMMSDDHVWVNEIKRRLRACDSKKITVTEDFIWGATKYIAEYPSYHRIEKKLKEAGVEICEQAK